MELAMMGIFCVVGIATVLGIIMMVSVLWDEKKDKERENKRTD
jgi:hypothetical protein